MPPKRVEVDPSTSSVDNQSNDSKLKPPARKGLNRNTPSLSPFGKTKSCMFPSLAGKNGGNSSSSSSEPSSDGEGPGDKDKCNIKDDSEDEDGDGEDIEWEDVFQTTIEPASVTDKPWPSNKAGDLQLTLGNNNNKIVTSTEGKKKGASAEERRIRAVTHCIHVQFLLFHGTKRNGWLCDPELQAIMLSHLTPSIMRDIEKFQARKGKKLDRGAVAKGVTDPALGLLGLLIHWWKKKFTVDAPGMRKNGYKKISRFREEQEQENKKFQFTTGNRGQDGRESYTLFRDEGERVENLEDFRKLAKECRGSRDIGAMLFTALLRAIGLEARMIFSLQPLGFGFTERDNFLEDGSATKGKSRGFLEKTRRKSNGKNKGKEVVTSGEEGEDDEDYDSDASGGFVCEQSTLDLPRKFKKLSYDRDLPYPIFWSEVYSGTSGKWITVESLVLTVLGSSQDLLAKFEPKGKRAADSKQAIAYVIAYSSDGTAKDITVKYLAKNTFPGKTKGARIPITNVSVYNYDGKVVAIHKRDWFGGVMRGYRKPDHLRTERERKEDNELQGFISNTEKVTGEQKESISYYKNNPGYVLERHLKRQEAVRPGKGHVKIFTAGKGEKSKEEKVYSRDDITICKTVENWYREGRVIKEGQQPLKRVKPRAATLNRKREIEEAKRDGEIVMQGLYSEEQTEIYNPDPIVDGRIPQNSFGNIDIYVQSMIPLGAIHLPLKGSGKLAKRLGIDYAEAVTGFEFKKQRAMPVIEGIVIAAENEDLLRDAWRAEGEEKRKKADGKRAKTTLAMWRRFLMGLRIMTRLREEYGDTDDSAVNINPLAAKKSQWVSEGQSHRNYERDEEGGVENSRGLFREGGDDEMRGGFARNDGNEADGGGGFFVDDDKEINRHGYSQVVFEDDEHNTPRDGGFFIPPTSSPKQDEAISLKDMMAQKAKQIARGRAESISEQRQSTASSEVRSIYFMSTASNDTGKTKIPTIVSDAEDQQLGPSSERGGLGWAPKMRIEVQIPITKRGTPRRKPRASMVSRTLTTHQASDTAPLDSSGPRRAPKRKAVVEAERKQSRCFMGNGGNSGDEEQSQSRKNRKTEGR